MQLRCWWYWETCMPCTHRQRINGEWDCVKEHELRNGSVGCMDEERKKDVANTDKPV